VISSLGADNEGMVFNINADTIAAEIAVQLHAEKLILLSDVDGIYLTPGDTATKLSRLTADEADKLIATGAATGGMIPKLQTCIDAVEGGVDAAVILDGRVPHAMLIEIFTRQGAGTLVRQG